MNWDNQNKDPWGNKNDAPDFDELIKKFSSILGGKKIHQPMVLGVEIRAADLNFHHQEYFYMGYLLFQ